MFRKILHLVQYKVALFLNFHKREENKTGSQIQEYSYPVSEYSSFPLSPFVESFFLQKKKHFCELPGLPLEDSSNPLD